MIKKYAIYRKRLVQHFAPAGWVTSFDISIEEINFKPTMEEAEKYIEENPLEERDQFYSIELIWCAPTPKDEG